MVSSYSQVYLIYIDIIVMIEHLVFMLIMLKILEEIQKYYKLRNVLIGIKQIKF